MTDHEHRMEFEVEDWKDGGGKGRQTMYSGTTWAMELGRIAALAWEAVGAGVRLGQSVIADRLRQWRGAEA